MGKSADGNDSTPIHSVTVSDFYISPYEVTQKLYTEIVGENPSHFNSSAADGENQDLRPVETVSFWDAVYFCNKLSIKEGYTPCYKINGYTDIQKWDYEPPYDRNRLSTFGIICNFNADGYRLPTESEWEFAAKGGNKGSGYIYSGSNEIDEVGWYSNNSNLITHEVGKKQENELGLYDMSGNVAEWCWTWHYPYSPSSDNNPSEGSRYHYQKGGHCCSTDLKVENCNQNLAGWYDSTTGFRLVRSAIKK